jgi:hypothetical protein
MTAHISGARDGQHWPGVGEVIDVPDLEGAGLVAAGLAAEEVAAKAAPKVEKATAPKPEKRA